MPRGKGVYVDDDDSEGDADRKVAAEKRAADGDPTPDVDDPGVEPPD
jgi:hypothetical protein